MEGLSFCDVVYRGKEREVGGEERHVRDVACVGRGRGR